MDTKEILQGIKDWAAPKVIYDISAAHNNTKYTDLSDALGTDGSNIPQEYRKGGITVRFVRTSDNKYVQARCMTQSFSTNEVDWQVVTNKVKAGSKDLVESGGVFDQLYTSVIDSSGSISATTRKVTFSDIRCTRDKEYKLKIIFSGLSDTDIDNLVYFYISTTKSVGDGVIRYNFTSVDRESIKETGVFDYCFTASVDTSFVLLYFDSDYVPTTGNLITVESYTYGLKFCTKEDVDEQITEQLYADVIENKNSISATNRKVAIDGIFLKSGNDYDIKVHFDGLSDTDIDNLLYFRISTSSNVSGTVIDYPFTSEDKNSIKSTGIFDYQYTAGQDSSYIVIMFITDYVPTTGNLITVESYTYGLKFCTKEKTNELIDKNLYDDVLDSQNSAIATGRKVAVGNILLENGNQYKIKVSFAGFSNEELDKLQYFRINNSTSVGDYVKSYEFTSEDIANIKSTGLFEYDYDSAHNTSYVVILFNPTFTESTGVIDVESYEHRQIFYTKEEVDEKIGFISNILYGKTIVCIGDSITEFKGRGEGVEPLSYPAYIEKMTGAKVINLGIGATNIMERANPIIDQTAGYKSSNYAALDMVNIVRAACGMRYNEEYSYLDLARIAAEYIRDNKPTHDDNTAQIQRLAAIDWSKVDYVIVLGGTNDWHGGTNAVWGNSGDTSPSTTMGAINYIINTLLTTYKHIKLFWITPLVRWNNIYDYHPSYDINIPEDFSDYWQYDGVNLREFSARIFNEVTLNHIPVYDAYNRLGWNMFNFPEYFNIDGTHPFSGFKYLATKIIKFLQSN